MDLLSRNLNLKDFYYYQTSLGSYLGINSQLPMILSEMRLDTKADIETYFEALQLTKGAFESCIRLEKEKIDAATFLTDADKIQMKETNTKLVNKNFRNAYIYLRDEAKNLIGNGANQKSMYYLPEGKEYYKALFAESTGTDDTIEEAKQLLEERKNELIDE